MIKRQAFTLIELLVVISIIALLISILLPALTKARFATKEVTCMTGLRQLAMGAIAYEVDEGRLPLHVAEGNYSHLFPTAISHNNPASDRRPLYEPYVSVNYFQCPFYEPRWDWTVENIAPGYRLYTPYIIGAGYYRDYDQATGWVSDDKAWVRSQDVWHFDGEPFNILFSDQLMRSSGNGMTRINHPAGRDAFVMVNQAKPVSAGYAGSYFQAYYSEDLRGQHSANYLAADGHGINLRGNDERQRDIPTLVDPTQSYLLPRR